MKRVVFFGITACLLIVGNTGFGQSTVVDYDFDAGTEGWVTSTDNTITPAGTASWIRGTSPFTGGDGTYFHIDPSNVYSDFMDISVTSPSIDFLGYSALTLEVDVRYNTESGFDGFRVEYNTGGSWIDLGAVGDGTNWYNDATITALDDADGWSGDNTGWATASIPLPVALEGLPSVQFRLRFASDFSVDDVGVAFDNFFIEGTFTTGPEIVILGNDVPITDGDVTPVFGDNTAFGGFTSGSTYSRTFTIRNGGTSDLDLQSTTPVSVSGTGFSVTSQPALQTISSGSTETFTIEFAPNSTSLSFPGTVTVTSDDVDESTYTFDISGDGAIDHFTFDAGTESWTTTTDGASSWITGTSPFNDGDGTNYFQIDPSGDYDDDVDITVTSPSIDLSDASSMTFNLFLRYDTEDDFDGMEIEYNGNDGGGWIDLGAVGSGTNWYNDTGVAALGDPGWSDDNGAWQLASIALPVALEDNNDVQFRVRFASDGSIDDLGVAFDNVYIAGTVISGPEIDVFGNGVGIADGDITPSIADDTDFGFTASDTHTFTITNNGNATLTISGLLTLSNTTDFNITQPGNTSIGIGASETFTVEFDPSGAGSFTSTVTINSDDADEGTYTFDVSGANLPEIDVFGNGVAIADGDVTPSVADSTDFGNTTNNTNTFTITNNGSADLTLSGAVSISPTTNFSISDAVDNLVISPGGSETFDVTFSPVGTGTVTATVTINSDDADEEPYTFDVQGTSAPEILVSGSGNEISNGDTSPSVADDTNFGSIDVDATITKTFTITNTGSGTLTLSGTPRVALTGATTHFSVTLQPSSTIAPNASTTFVVQFSPQAAGVHQVSVSIDNDDSDENPTTFTLQGAATASGGGSSGDFSCNCVAGSSDITVSTTVVLNDYFPGEADALSGAVSIDLGPRMAGAAGTTLEDGDLLLMIQMQGVEMNSSLPDAEIDGPYADGTGGNDRAGFVDTEDFTAGQYEYVVISDASGYDESTGGKIVLKNPVVNTYKHQVLQANFSDDLGRQTFQLVKVANYLNVNITGSGNVTAVPWNGRSGGIIVMDALTSLTLDGDIDANGLGFRGGLRRTTDVSGDNESPAVGFRGEGYAGTPSQSHGYDDAPLLGGSLSGFDLAAAESPGYPGTNATLDAISALGTSPYTFTYTPDRGHGGAGNAGGAGRYDGSGGGGGAGNRGGNGSYPNDGQIEDGTGVEPDDEFPNQGIGGGAKDIEDGRRAFLGGGGGSGGWDNETNFTQAVSSGQPGGGIIILRANSFTGVGTITASGIDGGTQGGEGAGGGGAGGSIIIVTDTEDLGSIILLSSEGGDGGSTNEGSDAGAGGAAGGEIIIIRRGGAISDVPATVNVDGGSPGTSGAGAGVAAGGSGGFETTSLPPPANLDCPLINIPPAAPGGVSGVLVWIKADADVTYDGDNQVSSWIDQSANGFDFTTNAGGQLSTTGSNPDFSDDLEGFNFNPAIDFNNGVTTDYLGFTGFSNFSNTALDVFAVSSTSYQAQDQTLMSFLDDADTENDYALELPTASGGSIQQRNTDAGLTTTATDIRDGISRIINTRYIADGAGNGNDSTEILVNNESLVTNNTFNVDLNTGLTDGTLVLGQDLDNLTDGGFDVNETFQGQIGEVIIYPMDLTADERSRVDTYLAIKYGITLFQDQDYLNSLSQTIFPGSTELIYDSNIAGVGRDDASGLVQLQSKSINNGSVLTGSSSNFDTDRSFVVWGSNAESAGIGTPSFASTAGGGPTEATDTLDLQWKAYVSNSPGPIDMEFDMTGFTNQPIATDVIGILIDEDLDGDFTTGNIRVEPYDNYDFGSGVVSFSNITFNNGEPFTLAVLPKAPGGVSANLGTWLRADLGVTTTGSGVSTWADQSTNGNDATQTTDGSRPPVTSDVINFNPSVTFDGGADFMESAYNDDPTNDVSLFTVFNSDADGTDAQLLWSQQNGTGTGRSVQYINDNGASTGNFFGGTGQNSSTGYTYQDWALSSYIYDHSATELDFFRNGLADGNFSVTAEAADGTWRLGSNKNAGQFFDGEIPETAIYSDEVSASDRNKIESYLAIRYGLTLDQTVNTNYRASNGSVVFPATSSLPDYISYANDIFGIARDDQSILAQTKSQSVNSDAIMTITNGNDPDNPASFTNNFTFLLVGNDNDDDGTIEEITTELPPNVTARLDREWRAAVTGNLGEVTLQFDVTGLGVSGTTVADFKVLVDRDGDFTDGFVQSFDATSYDSGTGIVTITGVSLSDDDVFTLSTGIPPKGPGGVTTGLQLWLRADIGAYQDTGAVTDADTDADPVFRWDDQSNGKQFTNDVFGGISGSSPTFRTDVPGFNFNPAIQFVNDGTENDYLANDGTHTWGSDVTLFGVFQTDGDNGTVISYDVDAGDDEFKLDSLGKVSVEVDEQTLNDFNDQDIADDRSYILAFDYEDGTDEYNLYIDGTADPNNSGSNGTATTIANDGTIVIGNDLNDAGNASTGGMITGSAGPGYDDYIGEMIVYNQVLSPTDRQKVQTYLGLKYGIFVDDGNPDFLSANGTVIYPGGESVFSNDIAGVGRDDLGNFIQPKSKSNESSAILTVEKNEDFNADGQYIVWAHNGESAGDSISSGLPSGIESRKKRVWKVELTNSPTGTVDLTIELGGNPDDVRLLFDASDPTFGSATVVNPSVIDNGDGTFTFQNVNVSNFSDGGYFTVGSVDEDETPLPVELLYFVGAQEADHIQLDWATATEINNDHFEVERSVDGEIWDVIGMVNGFGTTSTPQNYVHVDINPQIGVAYYRLRQVDFDGAFEYSSIIQVSYKFEDFDFNVYPNPFEQSFLIDIRGLSANERIPYRIVDLAGAVIHEGQFTADVNGRFRRQATISGTNAKGVYLFQMLREGQSITYKLIKQ